MIIRIVKLTFAPEHINDFLSFFDTINTVVSGFEGCHGMRLLQDIHHSNIVFTYSHWESEDALNNYRDSETFAGVWSTIKPWFGAKAEAWSVVTYYEGGPFTNGQGNASVPLVV